MILVLISQSSFSVVVEAASQPGTKRGISGTNTWTNETDYAALGGEWYYTWSLYASKAAGFITGLPFTPMFWNDLCLLDPNNTNFEKYCCASDETCGMPPRGATHVLGFNEPDLDVQSNMSVERALASWPVLVARSKSIGAAVGSPAMAGDPVGGAWMQEFMGNVSESVNFTTLHWYKGSDPEIVHNVTFLASWFIGDVRALINKYQKPVWVTEFNLQWGNLPFRYTTEEVIQFLALVLPFLESEPMAHRYAMFDVQTGTCAMTYAENGTVTPVGAFYASYQSPAPASATLTRADKIAIGVCSGVLGVGILIVLLIRRRRSEGGYLLVN